MGEPERSTGAVVPGTRSAGSLERGWFGRRWAWFVRQFADEETRAQRWFDLLSIVLFAPGALVIDRTTSSLEGILQGDVVPFRAYMLPLCLGSAALYLLWRWLGRREHWTQALFAGAFLPGALIAGGFGVLISPLTLVGLIVGWGLLGFAPLFAGFSLSRITIRCLRRARLEPRPWPALTMAVLTAAVVLGGTLAQGRVAKAIGRHHQQRLVQDVGRAESSRWKLRVLYVFPGTDVQVLRDAYWATDDEAERDRIDEHHRAITGDIVPHRERW